jgi:hypothetical protein
MIYRGSRDCIWDAAESILKEIPGSAIIIAIGVPHTVTTLAWTNLMPYDQDSNAWDAMESTIQMLKEE